jgi:hypothetical protein
MELIEYQRSVGVEKGRNGTAWSYLLVGSSKMVMRHLHTLLHHGFDL